MKEIKILKLIARKITFEKIKSKLVFISFVLVIGIILPISNVHSANIYVNGYGNIAIDGSLEVGDFDSFVHASSSLNNELGAVVELNSSGGNLQEAMRIGYYINFHRMGTITLKKCSSACAIIFFSGENYAATKSAEISIHKPYLIKDGEVILDNIGSDTWWRVYGYLISTLKNELLAEAILGFMYSTETHELYRIRPEQYDLLNILTN